VHCQSYFGVEREADSTIRAVDETRGIIMVYNNQPVDAVYSSNCGGHTQDNIFGSGNKIGYLTAIPDILNNKGLRFPLSPVGLEYWLIKPPAGILCDLSADSRSSNFRWVRIYSAKEVDEMANKIAPVGRVVKIIVIKRQDSGHASAIKIVGKNKTHVLKKELVIRQALGNLRSSMFKVEIKYSVSGEPEEFIFYGGGWGHGVGMCQSGAYGMASIGKSYSEILQHYFHAVGFKKIY